MNNVKKKDAYGHYFPDHLERVLQYGVGEICRFNSIGSLLAVACEEECVIWDLFTYSIIRQFRLDRSISDIRLIVFFFYVCVDQKIIKTIHY